MAATVAIALRNAPVRIPLRYTSWIIVGTSPPATHPQPLPQVPSTSGDEPQFTALRLFGRIVDSPRGNEGARLSQRRLQRRDPRVEWASRAALPDHRIARTRARK